MMDIVIRGLPIFSSSNLPSVIDVEKFEFSAYISSIKVDHF